MHTTKSGLMPCAYYEITIKYYVNVLKYNAYARGQWANLSWGYHGLSTSYSGRNTKRTQCGQGQTMLLCPDASLLHQ